LPVSLNRVQTTALAVVLALASLIFAASLQPAAADAKKKNRAHKVKKGPAGLAFYKPPKKTPKRHGKLIWANKATGVVPLKAAGWTKRVLYTSVTPAGKRTAVSGSVSVPKGKAPRGGWPVITYGHGTTGIADKCAPSRNTKNGPATDYISYTDADHNKWLRAGYAVVRSDYQGLGTPGTHPFLIGKASGRSMLDIVRAARDLSPRISKRYLIAGHSQGGHAALFAAGMAAKWTPDLKLRGTVSYAPASHIRTQAESLPALTAPSQLTALASLVVKGATVADPGLDPKKLLSDQVLAFYPQTERECLSRLSQSDNLGGIAPSELIREGADTEPLFDLLDKQNPAVKSTAPILLAQGDLDTVSFKFLTDLLNTELEAAGNRVDYRVYPGADHGQVLETARPDVMSFFQKRLPVRKKTN
jgi:pimeloyl-ACP methyl ester carboxylesterase